jgi:hypothetical protein
MDINCQYIEFHHSQIGLNFSGIQRPNTESSSFKLANLVVAFGSTKYSRQVLVQYLLHQIGYKPYQNSTFMFDWLVLMYFNYVASTA